MLREYAKLENGVWRAAHDNVLSGYRFGAKLPDGVVRGLNGVNSACWIGAVA